MFGLNPYAIGGALLLFIVSVGGSYFYGHNEGYQARQAEEVDTLGKQFKDYVTQAGDAAKAGTAAALADFKAKTALLETITNDLTKAKGIMANAAAQLSRSLRDSSCRLTPAQRQLLECVRRPRDAACTAAARPPV